MGKIYGKTIMKQIYLICLFLFLTQLCVSQTVAHFSIDKRKGCQPLTVNFVDSSYGGTVTKRDWDLGGLASNLANTGRNFTTAGKYTIKLTVTFSNGDVKTAFDTIHVYPLPVANFTLMNPADTAGCMSHKIQLKSLSTTATGTITKYNWDFGAGGNNGADPTPFFTYVNSGKYNVSLIVENNFGCKSNAATQYNYIKVYPVVNASLTIKNNFSCDTFLLSSFINTTTGGDGLSYKWYFGDGDSTIVTTKDTVKHLYKNPGNYIVKLVATNASNCKATYTTPNDKKIFVGKPKPSIVSADTVCSNTNVVLTGSSVPVAYSYKWIISDHNSTLYGATPTYKFDTPGTYTITLVASNYAGCSDTAKKQIVVKTGPVADFTMDQNIGCSLPFPVQFTYSGGANFTYDWNFGDGTPHSTLQSPLHTYTSQGYFHVSLKITDPATGCSNSITKNYAVGISIPKVDFTYLPSSGCRPLKVTVTAKVDYLLSPITVSRYIWNFGDGTIVDTTAASISHVYTITGTFYIRLTTITSKGCRDSSLTKPVVVADLCDDDGSGDGNGGGGGSGFVLGKSCADRYSVTFTDTVKNSQTLQWDFGDGSIINTGVLNPVTHNYNAAGGKIYTVTITRKNTVTNAITSSQKRIIIIDEKANFIPDKKDICKSMQVNFKTIGIDSSKIKKYTWDYGDQTARNVIDNAANYLQTGLYLNGNASHVYLKNGVFPVKLIIEDKLGCKDSMVYPVPISVQGPVAGFVATPLTGCGEKLNVTFTDTTKKNGSIPIQKWIWNFGDGSPVYTTDLDTVIKHVYSGYSNYSAYTVSLKVVDSIGCESEEIRIDHIKRYYPRANMYSYDTLLCGRLNVSVYNSSYAYNATYLWDFGDGSTANTYHASHTYAQNGIYTIKLIIKDSNNCMDSITRPAYIKLIKPKADFIIGDTSQCAPTAITFRDSSKYAISYHWYFDGADGGTDKDPSPHIYGDPGYYKVTLAIKGVNDCVDTISKIIHIKGPIAKLNIGPTKGCVPYTFHIGVGGTNIKSYAWDFGDGTPVLPSTDSAVNHVYLNSGKYLPNAILTSPEGCIVTLKSKDTVIVDELHTNFVTSPYEWCDSATVQFTDKSVTAPFSSIIKTQWIFGDGSSTTGPLTGPHIYKFPGTYSVSLIASSKYGCVDTVTKQDSIHVWVSPHISIMGDSLICLTPGSILKYTSVVNSADSIHTYKWSIDDVLVSTDQHLVLNFRSRGYHELKLEVANSHLCSSTIKRLIFIDSVKANFSINALHFCGSGTVQLKNETVSATPIDKTVWDLGNGVSFKALDTAYTYTVPGTYFIKLTASTINGCSDSVTTVQPVEVYTLPQSSIAGDTLQCHPGIISFKSSVNTTDSIDVYHWYLDNNPLPDSTKELSTYFNAGNHLLKLIVKTHNGCLDTVAKNVVVDSMKADFTVLTPYLCDKTDTARFTNLSYSVSGISGYQWYFGDGNSSQEIIPVHVYSNPPGTYEVALVVKSSSGCSDSVYKTAAIRQYSKPVVGIQSKLEICTGQELVFQSTIASDDTIQSMQWMIDSTVVDTTADLNYTFNQMGSYKIKFSVISNHGCVADASVTISVHPIPLPAVTADTTICSGTSVALHAHDGVDYKWLPLTGLSNASIADPVATPDTSIQYTVIVTNMFGCIATDSVTIKVDKRVKIKVKEVPPICSGGAVLLAASGNTNLFKWTPVLGLSDQYSANPVASPTVTTTYVVTGMSLNVCPDDSASVLVTVGEIPVLTVATDTAVVAGSSIQIHASVSNVPVTYQWKPWEGLSCSDCPNPFIENIREEKMYILTVTSQYGCKATDTIRISIFCEDDLLIPNAFTPNADGLNDVFYPQAPGYGLVKSMTIFNRWGEMVFNQEDFPLNDPAYGWNGTYQNTPIEGSNVFVYVIRLRCANGSSTAVTGKITLIR